MLVESETFCIALLRWYRSGPWYFHGLGSRSGRHQVQCECRAQRYRHIWLSSALIRDHPDCPGSVGRTVCHGQGNTERALTNASFSPAR